MDYSSISLGQDDHVPQGRREAGSAVQADHQRAAAHIACDYFPPAGGYFFVFRVAAASFADGRRFRLPGF